MRYVRKIVAMVLTLIFIGAVIICAGIALSIKNVNVSFVDYSGQYVAEYQKAVEQLDAIKGSSILFLTEGDIKSKIDGEHVRLVSYEKVMPCTVNVKIAEKIETFAIDTGEKFVIFDDQGEFVRYSQNSLNNIDASPNVLLVGVDEQDVKLVADVMKIFKNKFESVRSVVDNVSLKNTPTNKKITIKTRLGLSIEIVDYDKLLNEKMSAVYNKYLTLSESEKLCGKILCFSLQSSAIDVSAVYSTN